MSKPLLYLLAVLPLLVAALVFGRPAGTTRGVESRGFAKARSSVHSHAAAHAAPQARAARHSSWHDRTAIEDDDDSDGDDDVETVTLAPRPQHKNDVSSDAASELDTASAASPLLSMATASLRMTGRGIRPSGEHRSAADRPPRS